MNAKLNGFQKMWLSSVFEPYVEINEQANISYPFFFGVSDSYLHAKKRIMIVGQQTNRWPLYKRDWSIEDSQKWAIDYLNYQLHYSDEIVLKQRFGHRNSSPFWNFFKQFSNSGIVPCWNNIDKAQRSINGITKPLTEEIEQVLNCALPNSNRTLFQREVEIANPNAIVFITGPYYSGTMEAAMNLETGSLSDAGLSHETGCVCISEIAGFGIPTFWTYHPRHISSKKNPLDRCEIVKMIKDSL